MMLIGVCTERSGKAGAGDLSVAVRPVKGGESVPVLCCLLGGSVVEGRIPPSERSFPLL